MRLRTMVVTRKHYESGVHVSRCGVYLEKFLSFVDRTALSMGPGRTGAPSAEEPYLNEAVVVGYAWIPVGKFGGSLSSFAATELGARAIAAALERSHVSGDQVGYTVMGHALQAGAGQITARQAAFGGGVPLDVPAETINKVCLSGTSAIARASSLIALGEFDIVVAGGMESMSNAPYVLDKARFGYRQGDGVIKTPCCSTA